VTDGAISMCWADSVGIEEIEEAAVSQLIGSTAAPDPCSIVGAERHLDLDSTSMTT